MTSAENNSEKLALVYTPFPDENSAVTAARLLLEQRLVACVNIIPKMKSLFIWNGKLQDSTEVLMIAKTQTASVGELIKTIEDIHPYDIPAVLVLPVLASNDAFSIWLNGAISKP